MSGDAADLTDAEAADLLERVAHSAQVVLNEDELGDLERVATYLRSAGGGA